MFGGAKPLLMQNTTIKTVLQNFVVFPILATNFLFSPFGAAGSFQLALLTPDLNQATVSAETVNLQKLQQEQAKKIDAYFAKYDMPLEGYGMEFVKAAYENNIDPFLVPAIAVRESTGGIHACQSDKFNAYGWASCHRKVPFTSYNDAILTIALNLGGNNPKTEHYYKGKTTFQILQTFNPPHVVERYAHQVIDIMDTMATMEVSSEVATNS